SRGVWKTPNPRAGISTPLLRAIVVGALMGLSFSLAVGHGNHTAGPNLLPPCTYPADQRGTTSMMPPVGRTTRTDFTPAAAAPDDPARECRRGPVHGVDHRVHAVRVPPAHLRHDVARVVDLLRGPEPGHEVLVPRTDRGDHVRAAERRELDRERADAAGRPN